MKKYLLVATAAFVASSSVQASEGLSGAYAGVRVGHVSTKAEVKKATKTQDGATGFAGDIVAGYGMLMDSFYLGGEAMVGLDGTNETVSTDVKLKGGMTAGVAARLGYALTQKSMIYVSLGVASEKAEYKTANDPLNSKKKNLVSFVPGIGTQIAMTDSVAVRADFTYSMSKKLKVNTGTNEFTVQPKKAAFKVGVVYTF